jgi:sugar O-acyltransferase (sialic acid O-acetyltransferase NeuD family)
MRRLAILGGGGHGKVVADAALLAGWASVSFFDDAWPDVSAVGPWQVLGTSSQLFDSTSVFEGVIVAIGDNATRLAKCRTLISRGITLASIIHPAAVVSPFAECGQGTVVFASAVLNPFSRLGLCCILNTGSSVDHDCHLSDGVHVCPGARLGGGVTVGEGSFIGIGACARHRVSIGSRVVVGAGAVVVADVPDGLTVVGVPATRLRCKMPCPDDAERR